MGETESRSESVNTKVLGPQDLKKGVYGPFTKPTIIRTDVSITPLDKSQHIIADAKTVLYAHSSVDGRDIRPEIQRTLDVYADTTGKPVDLVVVCNPENDSYAYTNCGAYTSGVTATELYSTGDRLHLVATTSSNPNRFTVKKVL